MRCDVVRRALEEGGLEEADSPVREHLRTCPACESFARDWRLVRAGLRALREESAPQPTLGFAARVVRRLAESAETSPAEQFLEMVGRRVVYATLLLTLTLVLALALPSSGPLRGPTAADLLSAERGPEVVMAGNDPVFGYEFAEDVILAPAEPRIEREEIKR